MQLCVDLAAHIVSESELPLPGTMGQTFDLLADGGIISAPLAERMKKAVGFRNLTVHNYEEINWEIVFAIATHHLADFEEFARAVVSTAVEWPIFSTRHFRR